MALGVNFLGGGELYREGCAAAAVSELILTYDRVTQRTNIWFLKWPFRATEMQNEEFGYPQKNKDNKYFETNLMLPGNVKNVWTECL